MKLDNKSPPHPRGSTYFIPFGKRKPAVSPAPAGIDLTDCLSSSVLAGLPRTRGDRPYQIS